MNIDLHIERLILDGRLDIGPAGAAHVEAALRNRLVELLTEQGLPDEWGSAERSVRDVAGTMSIDRRPDGTTLGIRAAESLYIGLTSEAAGPDMRPGAARGD
jgi:hypothetical protein